MAAGAALWISWLLLSDPSFGRLKDGLVLKRTLVIAERISLRGPLAVDISQDPAGGAVLSINSRTARAGIRLGHRGEDDSSEVSLRSSGHNAGIRIWGSARHTFLQTYRGEGAPEELVSITGSGHSDPLIMAVGPRGQASARVFTGADVPIMGLNITGPDVPVGSSEVNLDYSTASTLSLSGLDGRTRGRMSVFTVTSCLSLYDRTASGLRLFVGRTKDGNGSVTFFDSVGRPVRNIP